MTVPEPLSGMLRRPRAASERVLQLVNTFGMFRARIPPEAREAAGCSCTVPAIQKNQGAKGD